MMSPEDAYTIIKSASESWPVEDRIRLATLIQLGRPADVVYGHPAKVNREKGDAPGETALRPVSSTDSSLRADVFHMWREVSRAAGVPL